MIGRSSLGRRQAKVPQAFFWPRQAPILSSEYEERRLGRLKSIWAKVCGSPRREFSFAHGKKGEAFLADKPLAEIRQ